MSPFFPQVFFGIQKKKVRLQIFGDWPVPSKVCVLLLQDLTNSKEIQTLNPCTCLKFYVHRSEIPIFVGSWWDVKKECFAEKSSLTTKVAVINAHVAEITDTTEMLRPRPTSSRIANLRITLLHIISVRPSKQPLMVRTFLKVYMELGSYFLFLQEQIKDIIINPYVLTDIVTLSSDIAS